MSDAASSTLLEVEDLHSEFPMKAGTVQAVAGVSFSVCAGERLAIVGESGSGKSATMLSVMRLLPRPGRITRGRVLYKGRDLTQLQDAELRALRGAEIAMIFQDPMTSLNPVFKIGWQVGEPLRLHKGAGRHEAFEAAVEMFRRVGLPAPAARANDYPHQFSGGMRQRAMIAMGLTTRPAILIADEPTTALDVTIQAQILELLRSVTQDYGTATILITHNLGVVAGMCDRVIVMYAGRIVEQGRTDDVFASPKHPYTWALLRSIPRLDAKVHEPLRPIEGMPPDMSNPPSGCPFHPRCPFRLAKCSEEEPPLAQVGAQLARCWVTQAGVDLNSAETTTVTSA